MSEQHVVIVTFDGAQILDVTGPLEVFSSASRRHDRRHQPALVAQDHGRQTAATVARQLVVYLRRSGGQAQSSTLLAAQTRDSVPVRDLLSWLPDHITMTSPSRHGAQGEPVGATVHPSLRGRLRSDARRPHRGGPGGGRLPTARDHSHVDREDCPGLRLRHPRDDEPAFRRRLGTTPGGHRHHFGEVDS